MRDDWSESVSLRLACLALDRKGRLTKDLVTGIAVRGAVLIDLALRGRVRDGEEAIEYDDQPTGFPPADRILRAPAQSLTDLLRHGPVDQRDLAAEHLRRGTWLASGSRWRRRYVDHTSDRTKEDELAMTSGPDRIWEPVDASLAAIASTLGVLATPRALPTDALLAASEPVRWLVEVTVAEMDRMTTRARFMGRALPSPGPIPR